MRRGRSRARRRWAATLLATLAPLGCAYSMVVDGALRRDALDDLTTRAAVARGLPRRGEVPARVIRRADVNAVIRASLARDWTPAQLADYQEGLISVGVWPPDHDLAEDFVALMQDQVAGLYVPAERLLYVVEDAKRPLLIRLLSSLTRRDLMLEFSLSHEIVHWLQHRAYPWLLDEDATWKGQDDYVFSVQTAIEGDAMHYGLAAMSAGAALPSPAKLAAEAGELPDRDVPALLRLTLLLPYAAGYRLSYQEGASLLDHPPASSEQAIHPERRHEPFRVADLAALRAVLPDGCRVVAENTLGEVGISVLFRDLAPDPPDQAWQGWDGDRYLAARCGERRELAWWTCWDDETQAREFAAAYAEIAEAARARAGFSTAPVPWQQGATVAVATTAFGPPGRWLAALRTARVASGPELRQFFAAPYASPGAPAPPGAAQAARPTSESP